MKVSMPRKKTRNIIYKRALELYMEDVRTANNPSGLCYYLVDAICEKKYQYSSWYKNRTGGLITLLLPEIYKHTPTSYYVFWFPLDDTKSRIDILNQAIKETEA